MSVVLGVICGIMGVGGALLCTGRGAFLIAGYNTMSAKEKAAARLNEAAICRATGVFVLGVTAATVGLGLVLGYLPGLATAYTVLYVAFLTVGTGVFAVWVNKSGRFRV